MQNFLVPVDFSNISFNAFKYARELAGHYGAQISLLHVFTTDIVVNQPMLQTFDPERLKALEERMRNFLSDKEGNPVKDVELNIVPGTIVHEILECSKDPKYDMIIIGTREKHSPIERWLGTVSSAIAKSAHCPVLLVPNGSKYQPIDNIVIASDTLIGEPAIIDRLKSISRIFNATLHFVHVRQDDNQDDEFDTLKDSLVEALLVDGKNIIPFECITIEHEDVSDALFEYAGQHSGEMILLISKHRNFIQNLLHVSMTKQVVMKSELPVLVLHEKNLTGNGEVDNDHQR